MHSTDPITRSPEIKETLLISKSKHGKNKRVLPDVFDTAPLDGIDKDLINNDLPEIPDVSEVETVRHFTRLSRLNYGLENGMYPLGSCTMKYNPKICEKISALFSDIHPADDKAMAYVVNLLARLGNYLKEICGMDAYTLWPAAGAHGELTGMMIIKKAMDTRKANRQKVLIPDTAHGTNPSSCTIAGFRAVQIPSGEDGYLKASTLKKYIDSNVAALMITNPNTLGIFEQEIRDIAELLHENGSYLYMDGANMNAIMGIARPGDMGVDCMHLNLHKTFSSPHGGGGPGSGPVLVSKELSPYLPVPWIVQDDPRNWSLVWDAPMSIGRVHSGLGNLSILIKALIYILSLGSDGIKESAEMATLIANYMRFQLSQHYYLPYKTPTLHEFVLTDRLQKEKGVSTMDIAKALMDFGFHPPTIYFPLVVNDALMIEPTETEPLDEIERFVSAMKAISDLSKQDPDRFKTMPSTTAVSKVDEVWAARHLVLTWDMIESNRNRNSSK